MTHRTFLRLAALFAEELCSSGGSKTVLSQLCRLFVDDKDGGIAADHVRMHFGKVEESVSKQFDGWEYKERSGDSKIRLMSNEKRADYSESFLFPPSLEDWVREDHPARFIREVVDALDLRELGFRMRDSEEGRPNYAPDLLLKVWLYGYLMRIRSSRGLERACRENVGLIWLTGMNEPDHNTLWRFFSENKKALRNVFKQVVRIALKAKLLGLVLHAVDGTKIIAHASRSGGLHKVNLEKALRKLDQSIEEAMGKIETAEVEEQGEYRLPEELREKGQLREKIKAALEEM
jgi:transposase